MTYTEDEVNELNLCKEDIIYFAENYIKIDKSLIQLYPKQKEILINWNTKKLNVSNASRQSGMSTLYAIFLLHNSLFKIDRHSAMCCNSYNNAINMQEIVMDMYVNLPNFLKPSIMNSYKDKISFINGSRITFLSIRDVEPLRGHSLRNIILDNIDYVDENKINSFLQCMVPCLKHSPSSRIIVGGTPKQLNGKQLELSRTEGWNVTTITYKDIPHHCTPEWEKAMRDIAGDDTFNNEFALEYAT